MIIRTALLIGSVPPEKQDVFDAYMREDVIAALKTYPGILDVSLRKMAFGDDDAPQIYMQFDLMFESVDAMNAALDSPVRDVIQAQIKACMADFNGSVTHFVSDVLIRPGGGVE